MQSEVWKKLKNERLALAEFLEDLSIAAWNKQSLAAEWKIRDVVAHIILESSYKPAAVARGMLAARGNPNRFIAQAARELGKKEPAELIALLRKIAPVRKTPLGITAREALVDCYIHELDIKLPLGIKQPLSAEQELFILKTAIHAKYLFGAYILGLHARTSNLRFVANDIEWSYGRGPLVQGPAQAIILVLTGRHLGLKSLTGEGVQALQKRLKKA